MSGAGFSPQEVADLLGVNVDNVRGWVRSGLVAPERGQGGTLAFTFQDLAVLRTAQGLVSDRVPARRVRMALEKVRARLPDGRPLSGVALATVGKDVVVREAGAHWHAESGQGLLPFEGTGEEGVVESLGPILPEPTPSEAAAEEPPPGADASYRLGCEIEDGDPAGAIKAYLRAITIEPAHADAHINLGRLLHETGEHCAAEAHYRMALAARGGDATATFNLGVVLEDMGRITEAIQCYESAVRIGGANADAHWNVARLYERLGEKAAALRHLRAYRHLTPR